MTTRWKYPGDAPLPPARNSRVAFILERLCKASAEAKFTWIMPSRRQFSCKRVQSRIYSGYAERSRKSQSKYVVLVKIRTTYKVAII